MKEEKWLYEEICKQWSRGENDGLPRKTKSQRYRHCVGGRGILV